MNANDTLLYLKELLLLYLDELKNVENEDGTQYEYGEKAAYTECLEVLQIWENAAVNGLDFDIEQRYPLK